MKNINKRTLALILAVALVLALAGCAATSLNLDELYDDVMALQASVDAYAASKGAEADHAYIEAEEEVESDALTEYELLPFARFSNLYVTEGTEIADYLAYVTVIDEEVVTAITADASVVDLSTAGDYELVYTVTVNKDMYDAYLAAQEYLTVTEADEGIDNVEHLGLVNGEEYTIEVKYLIGPENEDAIPSLLRDENGDIVKTETTFTVEGDSGELQIEHITSLYPEGKVVTPVYFLLSGDTVEADEVIVTKIVHVYSDEEYMAEVEAGTITESEDGVATSAETEVVTPAPTATAKPTTTATPSVTEKPTSTATPTATATPKPSTGTTTTTATATPAPTAKPSTTTTTATATPVPTASHTHSYTSTVTTAATCTTAGVRTYTCSCGASYTESIPATGHNWVTETVSDGYYTTVTDQAAYDEYIAGYWQCNGCGETFSSFDDFDYHNYTQHDWRATYTKIASQTIHHDAITHQEWIDTSYTITRCSVCGATQ